MHERTAPVARDARGTRQCHRRRARAATAGRAGGRARGRRAPVGGPVVRLPWRRNRLECVRRAVVPRSRALRHQVRLRAVPNNDAPEPLFRFVDRVGRYKAGVRASLDGDGPSPAACGSGRAPVVAAGVGDRTVRGGAAGLLYGLHRMRIGVLVRLEQQRLRIARDLHDEMCRTASELGSSCARCTGAPTLARSFARIASARVRAA